MYEVFEHTADLGLRIRAADLNELFAQAGQALFGVIVSNPQDVRASETVAYEIAGTEPDYLLFDWLNELLYTFESRRLLLAKFDVHVRPSGLTARAAGEKVDTARHRLEHEVKAITYHGLKLEPDGDGWLAEVILDI